MTNEIQYADWLLSKATKNGDCLECHFSDVSNGYCKVASDETAHRFIYRVKKGPPNNLYVLHECDNRRCINPDHLFLDTALDNTQDRISKGRKGKTGLARALSVEQELEVLKMRKDKYRVWMIADKFKVSHRTIYNVFYRYADAS